MKLLGILNVTPDSFSDGGLNFKPEVGLKSSEQMLADGASFIDVGAESTRPGATKLSHKEEWHRLEPILTALKTENIPISLDSYHHETVEKALDYNISIINDVNGLNNPKMQEIAARSGLDVIAMHSLTVPADRDVVLPENKDVTKEIIKWGKAKVKQLTKTGIKKDNIILDVGIGFGKTSKQSWQLIKDAPTICKKFKKLGVKTLYGHSRKSFLKDIRNNTDFNKDTQTAAITGHLYTSKVDFVRVHDIKLNYSVIKALEPIN